jgi:hypothetical protein
MSTLRTINVVHPSGTTTNIVNDASGNVAIGNNLTVAGTSTFTGNVVGNVTVAGTVAMGSSFKRNRIINGNMVVNQRGYISSAALTTSPSFCTDRFSITSTTTGGFSAYQSTGAPTGFINSLSFNKTTGAAPAATDTNYIYQAIEGYNISDLAWGTANAKTITLSFWVYAGSTGTFGGSIRNPLPPLYSYPFAYTIAAANTWTQISITIVGPTVGTWATDNTQGMYVFFDLGSGSNFRATAGAWTSGNYVGATGATTYPTSTSGGYFFITGVQLEVGTKATPYEMQIYSDQLAQCQRYYYNTNLSSSTGGIYTATTGAGLNSIYPPISNPVPMRTTPTVVLTKLGGGSPDVPMTIYPSTGYIRFVSGTTGNATDYNWSADAEL